MAQQDSGASRPGVKLENFNDTFPHCLSSECLFHGHALDVR